MSEHLDELEPVDVTVVHFDQVDRLADYRRHLDLDERIRLLTDPGRTLYEALGIGRGRWWRVWGPRTVVAYARLLRRGRGYRRHRGDSLQLGGNVVLADRGRVAWTSRPAEPDDRPTVDELAAVLDDLRA